MKKKLSPPAKPRTRQLPRRHIAVVALAIVSIAIVVIYVRDWPRMRVSASSPAPINLARTGVSPEIEAAINGRFPGASSVPISPESADRFAGMPMDPAAPLAPYGMPMPKSREKGIVEAGDHKKAANKAQAKTQ